MALFLKGVRLETERLILRNFTLQDTQRVYELAKDKQISDTTTLPYPYELKHAKQWIEKHETQRLNGECLQFAICLKSTQEIIGCISYIFGTDQFRAELGYWIGVPYWGNSYCTEAVGKLIDYAFNELKLTKLTAHYMAHNASSGKVMKKCGMTQVAHFKKHIFKNNQYYDAIYFEILAEEYMAN